MIICKRSGSRDDHLQEAGSSGWSFAKGQPLWTIICKRPASPDDHPQEAGPSGQSLAKASPSGWSFARGRSLRMILCKSPATLDDYLQEANNNRVTGPGDHGWRDRRRRGGEESLAIPRTHWPTKGRTEGPRGPIYLFFFLAIFLAI